MRNEALRRHDSWRMLCLQDVLPIAPFFTDQELYKAEWKVECFMRDVLVPLAAETNALVIGAGQTMS